ncbi:MAG: hypothetical protein C0467_22870 [Planctomycetaceae bacterium]|nr:hypothetical protein [Planctomycetaceae bacterium]
MRKGILGSIAALAAGAGAAWGQVPMPVAPAGGAPAAIGQAGDIIPVQGPNPVLMPPLAVGPPGDPQGMGPVGGFGPPPGPMYPPPGPYTAPQYQPSTTQGYGNAPTVWFKGEYMILFGESQPGSGFPILTSGSPTQAGVVGQPTTTVLIGGGEINYGGISGFRLGGGFFGDTDRRFGFDFGAFYAQPTQYSKTFDANSANAGPLTVNGNTSAFGAAVGTGIPVLARPFIDTNAGNTTLVIVSPLSPGAVTPVPGGVPLPTSAIVGLPNLSVGSASVSTRTSLWAADPSAIFNVFRSKPESRLSLSLDLLAGYKYAQLNEEFVIQSQTLLRGVTFANIAQRVPVLDGNGNPIIGPPPFFIPVTRLVITTQRLPISTSVGGVSTASPSTLDVADRFVTTNRFNGGNIGFRADARYGMFTLSTTGKVAVGNMHQTLRIRGITSFQDTSTGAAGFAYSGLYANSSNIGTYTNDEFSIIPDLNLTVGINLTRSLSMYVGYNVIYMNRVLRPGNQLNPIIDGTTIPFSPTYSAAGSIPAPLKGLIQDDYLLQGASFGFGFKY